MLRELTELKQWQEIISKTRDIGRVHISIKKVINTIVNTFLRINTELIVN